MLREARLSKNCRYWSVATLKEGKKGFKIYLGGGLGAASFIAHLLEEFTDENKLLPTCMAVSDYSIDRAIVKIWQETG